MPALGSRGSVEKPGSGGSAKQSFWDGGRPRGPLAVRTRIAMGLDLEAGLWMRVGPELCKKRTVEEFWPAGLFGSDADVANE